MKKLLLCLMLALSINVFSDESVNESLINAKDLEAAKEALAKGADLNTDTNPWSALHNAAYNGYTDIVEFLLIEGADVDAKNHSDSTALHIAAEYGHIDIAELLLEKGADIEAKDNCGETPLFYAESGDKLETMGFLHINGADIHAQNKYGETLIHKAVYHNNLKPFAFLFVKGVDINTPDKYGSTPLHEAASYDRKGIAHFLIQRGADVNAKNQLGKTPLFLAIQSSPLSQGHVEMVELLLDNGADTRTVIVIDGEKFTPLTLAQRLGEEEIVRLIRAKS